MALLASNIESFRELWGLSIDPYALDMSKPASKAEAPVADDESWLEDALGVESISSEDSVTEIMTPTVDHKGIVSSAWAVAVGCASASKLPCDDGDIPVRAKVLTPVAGEERVLTLAGVDDADEVRALFDDIISDEDL